jgi:hypothetical protein
MSHGHNRTRFVGLVMSEPDYERLVERSARAGAKTVSAYIRAACLTGREFEMPAHETLRDLRNAVIGANIARDHPALINALDRISQLDL